MPGSIVASLIFLLIPLTLLPRCGAADSITTYGVVPNKTCGGSGNFSSDGGIVFQMNLRQFLATLPSNVIKNGGSFNGSVGSTNAVFGMAMCQADLPWATLICGQPYGRRPYGRFSDSTFFSVFRKFFVVF